MSGRNEDIGHLPPDLQERIRQDWARIDKAEREAARQEQIFKATANELLSVGDVAFVDTVFSSESAYPFLSWSAGWREFVRDQLALRDFRWRVKAFEADPLAE